MDNNNTFLDSIERFFIQFERLINAVFIGINAIITNTEYSFLNLVTVIIPWLVFLAPAAMTWQNTGEHLDFPIWLRWAVAIVIEGLGLVAGSELLRTIWHNKRRENRAQEKKLNVGIPAVASIFYLAITIVLNALLDTMGDQVWVQVLSRAMLTVMGAVAISIVAVRGLRNDMTLSDGTHSRQMRDSYDSSGSYTTYDYRTEVGNVLTLSEKTQLTEMGRSNLRRYLLEKYQGINPEIAMRWIRYMERDIEEGEDS